MENYKDLIVTLIKNHRRYPGCEDILDEIVNEVMSKAKAVVENVDDEKTVRNYLIKTVSAAMIIVPKRHNITTRMTRRSNLSDMALPKPTPVVEESVEPENITLDSNMVEETSTEDIVLKLDNTTDILNTLQESDNENDFPEAEEIVSASADSIIEEELEIAPETKEELPEIDEIQSAEEQQEVNNSLVDRMINEIAPEDSGIAYNNEDTELEELDAISDFEELEQDSTLDETLDIAEDSVEIGTDTDNIVNNEAKNYTLPDLQLFNIEYFDKELNLDDVHNDLTELINKHPDKQYGTIWKLKYIDNKSTDEIAESLNCDIETVLERLEDIINVVED